MAVFISRVLRAHNVIAKVESHTSFSVSHGVQQTKNELKAIRIKAGLSCNKKIQLL